MNAKKVRKTIMTLAMAFAFVGAFAFNNHNVEEETLVIAFYDDGINDCNALTICSMEFMATCTSIEGFSAYMNGGTICSVRLGSPYL